MRLERQPVTAPVDDDTDAAAIAASLREPERFALLFDRHFDAVHAYVQRRLGASHADDVASETFTRAFDGRARYDLRQPDARPWLLGIATNLMRRHWRTERRRLAAYTRLDTGADTPAPAAGLPADVAATLRSLSRGEREALLLLAWADLSYDEIATALNLPLGTVRSRLSRARKRLRQTVGEAAGRVEAATVSETQPPKEASDV